MNPFFRTDFSISDSLKTVRKSVLIYETIIEEAFRIMKYNIEMAKESLISIMIKKGEDTELIERMKEEFDRLM